MIFLMGVLGFVGGFLFGQMVLSFLLRDRSREDILKLMEDKRMRMKYGLINWLCAIMGAACFISTYKRYFIETGL